MYISNNCNFQLLIIVKSSKLGQGREYRKYAQGSHVAKIIMCMFSNNMKLLQRVCYTKDMIHDMAENSRELDNNLSSCKITSKKRFPAHAKG